MADQKSSETGLKMVTIRLYDRDIELLKKFYPTVGYNAAVRRIVNKFVHLLETRYAESGGEENEYQIRKEAESVLERDGKPGGAADTGPGSEGSQ